MAQALSGPSTELGGGLRVSGADDAAWKRDFLDVPCSMLARDLACLGSDRWLQVDDRWVLRAPQGSVAAIEGADPSEVARTLLSAGPKILQVFAAATALRSTGIEDFCARHLCLPGHGTGDLVALLEAMSNVRFLAGPSSRRRSYEPGLLLHSRYHGRELRFSVSEEWLRELTGRERRIARLPASFLALHAKNDRYTILLAWHLAIMLRVNRKYGFHYRVRLRTLLDGAGIDVPHRNIGRFLAAIYRSLQAIPGVNASGPLHTLYASEEILSAKFSFVASPEMVAAYGSPECASFGGLKTCRSW